MRRLITALTLAAAAAAPLAALAQDSGSEAAGSAAGAAIAGGMMLFFLIAIAIGVLFLVFWVFMLIDCSKRAFPQRDTWLAILIISFLLGFHWLSAVIYFFMVKKANVGTLAGQNVPPTAPPTAPPAA